MSDRKKVLELFKEIFLDKMKSDEKNETYKRYFSKTFNMAGDKIECNHLM